MEAHAVDRTGDMLPDRDVVEFAVERVRAHLEGDPHGVVELGALSACVWVHTRLDRDPLERDRADVAEPEVLHAENEEVALSLLHLDAQLGRVDERGAELDARQHDTAQIAVDSVDFNAHFQR